MLYEYKRGGHHVSIKKNLKTSDIWVLSLINPTSHSFIGDV